MSVGWWKTQHFKGYYGLLELFIPVNQGLKFVFFLTNLYLS